MKLLILLFLYLGQVVDPQGRSLSYATIYSEESPELGTATNPEGYFEIQSDTPLSGNLILSYIGYAKQSIAADQLLDRPNKDPEVIVMREQPLALEEMVVSSKRYRNKRKMMRALLDEVWTQIEADFTSAPVAYEVVSDVRLDQDTVPWGVEQLIALSYEIPSDQKGGRDKVQFIPKYRKRYMYEGLREKADAFKHSQAIERMDQKGKKKRKGGYDLKWTIQNVDSGVVVHKSLWTWWSVKSEFEKAMHDKERHWAVSRENEGETVLTHTDQKNFLGIFKYIYHRHFILDSQTLSVKRFSQQGEVWVNIPFGYKLSEDQLAFLNLFNMSEKEIERFRVQKGHATILLNTIYTRASGRMIKQERNLHINALITGSRKSTVRTIPIDVKATQRGREIR